MSIIKINKDKVNVSEKNIIKELRKNAYSEEADSIFFKWQAGECEKEDWLEKRKEIKERYPYNE